MTRKHNTAREALGHLEGGIKDDQLSPIAEKLQRQRRIAEQADAERNARLRRNREQQDRELGQVS